MLPWRRMRAIPPLLLLLPRDVTLLLLHIGLALMLLLLRLLFWRAIPLLLLSMVPLARLATIGQGMLPGMHATLLDNSLHCRHYAVGLPAMGGRQVQAAQADTARPAVSSWRRTWRHE